MATNPNSLWCCSAAALGGVGDVVGGGGQGL